MALFVPLAACAGDGPDPAAHCPAREPIECATDLGGRTDTTVTGTTVGADDGGDVSGCGIGGGEAVEDARFRWTAPRAGRYRFTTEGSSFDTILSARRGSCTGREIVCSDDADGASHSTITLELAECDTLTLVVDGHDADGVGAFALSISGTLEAACDDALDDDGDGLVDCDDPDCASPRCDALARDWPDAWAALEAGVLEAVNAQRAAGAVCDGETMPAVPPLERDALLELAARLHSFDMIEQSYFAHEGLDGSTPPDRVARVGSEATGVGENIASGQTSVEQVMAGWMSSAGHCRNIMDARYRALGVGYADGAAGTRWTQNFAVSP